MEKAVRTKRVYMKPESKVYPVPVEHLLDAASGNAGCYRLWWRWW